MLTLARNRIGFYLQSVFWRRTIYTHLIFFNRFSGAYHFYEKIVRTLGASPPSSLEDCRAQIGSSLRLAGQIRRPPGSGLRIGVGHACSDLSVERMMSPSQWEQFFNRNLPDRDDVEVHLLGGRDDRQLAQRIGERLEATFTRVGFHNHCGEAKLSDSLLILAGMDEFWGIDSSLLHYARLFGLKCRSVWGPTAPRTLLKPFPGLEEEIWYAGVPCSPCVHITEIPPCHGNNICIKTLFEPIEEPDIPDITLLPSRTTGKGRLGEPENETSSPPLLRHPQPFAEPQRD